MSQKCSKASCILASITEIMIRIDLLVVKYMIGNFSISAEKMAFPANYNDEMLEKIKACFLCIKVTPR